jgi:hypothetical protein
MNGEDNNNNNNGSNLIAPQLLCLFYNLTVLVATGYFIRDYGWSPFAMVIAYYLQASVRMVREHGQ